MSPRVLCTSAAAVKFAGSCGKSRLVRGVAAESEVDVAMVGWAVSSLSVTTGCRSKLLSSMARSDGGVLLLMDERIVVN